MFFTGGSAHAFAGVRLHCIFSDSARRTPEDCRIGATLSGAVSDSSVYGMTAEFYQMVDVTVKCNTGMVIGSVAPEDAAARPDYEDGEAEMPDSQEQKRKYVLKRCVPARKVTSYSVNLPKKTRKRPMRF